jgi:hypothetical protein
MGIEIFRKDSLYFYRLSCQIVVSRILIKKKVSWIIFNANVCTNFI